MTAKMSRDCSRLGIMCIKKRRYKEKVNTFLASVRDP